jgi:hypothetical protein
MDDKELDIVLKHVDSLAKYKDAFEQMCSYYVSLMEGDDIYVEDAHKLMRKFSIIDEDGEIIYDDE